MKGRILLLVATVLLAVVIATFLSFSSSSPPPQALLPTPNDYDDFAAAAQWLVAWNGDLRAPPEEIRSAVGQNSKALAMVRGGLKKQSAVPVTNDMNWFSAHMVQMRAHKQLAQILIAEGLIHLHEGRTNEAARSFADCIAFAHAAHRRGLTRGSTSVRSQRCGW